MKLNRETVHLLHGSSGMSFAEIGRMYKVTRQYVYNLFSGYDTIYKKTDKHRMYRRHLMHSPSTQPTKPCQYCVNEHNVNVIV